jgi:hypothetical protein
MHLAAGEPMRPSLLVPSVLVACALVSSPDASSTTVTSGKPATTAASAQVDHVVEGVRLEPAL